MKDRQKDRKFETNHTIKKQTKRRKNERKKDRKKKEQKERKKEARVGAPAVDSGGEGPAGLWFRVSQASGFCSINLKKMSQRTLSPKSVLHITVA